MGEALARVDVETRVLRTDALQPDPEAIRTAAEAIRRGELVAFPTETVYGLAADALNPEAVARVYEVKGRPANNPLPVQVASVDEIPLVAVDVPDVARELIRRFMPGPLTIVLRASPRVPELVTAGAGTVGIRIPDHRVALELLRAAGTPIVAPSANPSGEPPPTSADDVLAYLGGRIEYILDAGTTKLKTASTVVDLTSEPRRILRHGAITDDELAPFLSV